MGRAAQKRAAARTATPVKPVVGSGRTERPTATRNGDSLSAGSLSAALGLLAEVRDERAALALREVALIGELRREHECSWRLLGEALGCSAQAAQQRYGRMLEVGAL